MLLNPFKLMEPLAALQPDGFIKLVEEIFGVGFMITLTEAGNELQLFSVEVTVYVPAFDACTLFIAGFCKVEEKLLGPVQL